MYICKLHNIIYKKLIKDIISNIKESNQKLNKERIDIELNF